jgi:hypothetical protein
MLTLFGIVAIFDIVQVSLAFFYRSRSSFEPANFGLCFEDGLDDGVSIIGVCTWPTSLHLHLAVFEPV